MRKNPEYGTERTASYTAKRLLLSRGFSVMMAAGHELFDLVAWRGKDEMIFLLVKSSRSPVSIGSYRPEVRKLTSIVKENSHPGEIQFWIKSWNEWLRYRIMPGGAVSIGGDLL